MLKGQFTTTFSSQVTHQVLSTRNHKGQTLLSLIEVNRECLPESLTLILKHEYGCHRQDMNMTELCISQQLESSIGTEIVLQQLYQMKPKSCCELSRIWLVLFLSSLVPNLTLGLMDIFADSWLSKQYYDEWNNEFSFDSMSIRDDS